MNASAATVAKLQQPLRRQQLRRPLLGSLALLAVSMLAWNAGFVGGAAGGMRTGMQEARRNGATSKPNLKGSLVAMQAAPAQTEEKEMSDLELLFDRFNNRGGAILAIILLTVLGVAMEKGLEIVGVESMTAGIYVSAVYFILMLGWVSTYVFRVFTKGTTYAEQLSRYEQAVMVKRLQELDEDEIEALCEEVGISSEDINQALGGRQEGQSQKDAVIQLFRSTQVGKKQQEKDPRDFFGGFNSDSKTAAAPAPAAQKETEPASRA